MGYYINLEEEMAKPVKPSADRVVKSGLISRPKAPQEASHLAGKLIFFPGWCKKCGLCTVVCPTGTLKFNGEGNPVLAHQDKCKLCSFCWRICPDFAIVMNPGEEEGNDTA
jgi:2-oxoglutarate ferredoxin oxidoreductase subunit delta